MSSRTSGHFGSGGLSLHYLEYGSGPTDLVVVPGITSPAITWEFVAERLADEYRVLILDVRGRGLSDKPAHGFSLRDYADDLAAMVRELGLARPALLGHSMGARIVAAFAVLHPGSAGPLVIADPPLSGPGRDPYPITLERFREQIRQARAGLTVAEVRRQYPRWSEDACRLRAEWLATCDETAVVESHRGFENEDILPYLRKLSPPALFVYGLDSPVVTEAGAREVADANPVLEIVGIPDAAHMLPWENLDGFLEPTRRFLAGATRPADPVVKGGPE